MDSGHEGQGNVSLFDGGKRFDSCEQGQGEKKKGQLQSPLLNPRRDRSLKRGEKFHHRRQKTQREGKMNGQGVEEERGSHDAPLSDEGAWVFSRWGYSSICRLPDA